MANGFAEIQTALKYINEVMELHFMGFGIWIVIL